MASVGIPTDRGQFASSGDSAVDVISSVCRNRERRHDQFVRLFAVDNAKTNLPETKF